MDEHKKGAVAPDTQVAGSRRSLLTAIAAGVGGATFFGPWKVNHAWAQAAQKKPLVIGLTMDASGQYAASGVEERLGAMMAIKEFNAKGGVLGRHDRGDAHRYRDHARHRLARRRAHDHAQRSRVPDRRLAFGRGQRDLAGRAEVRLHLLQHQLELAHRVGQGLPSREVRVGRQRHQLRRGHRQERDQGQRQELGAAHQRLRVGPQHGQGDAHAGRGQRRQDRRRADDPAEHARLLVATSSSCSRSSRRSWPPRSAATTSRRCASRSCSSACRSAWRGSTTSRTGRTCTASGPSRSSACSAPTGTGCSTCPA